MMLVFQATAISIFGPLPAIEQQRNRKEAIKSKLKTHKKIISIHVPSFCAVFLISVKGLEFNSTAFYAIFQPIIDRISRGIHTDSYAHIRTN